MSQTQLLSHDDKRLVLFHRVIRDTDGVLAATNEAKFLGFNLKARRAETWRPRVAATLAETNARAPRIADAGTGRAGDRTEAAITQYACAWPSFVQAVIHGEAFCKTPDHRWRHNRLLYRLSPCESWGKRGRPAGTRGPDRGARPGTQPGLSASYERSANTTRMLKRSVAMYDALEAETGMAFDWKKVGSLRLAATAERLLEAKRLATMARGFDLEMEIISAAEAKDLFPLIDATGLHGAAFIPSDGHVDPASLCQAIAAGARMHGVEIRQGVTVTDFTVTGGRITQVITDQGTYEADTITLAAGMWSPGTRRETGDENPGLRG